MNFFIQIVFRPTNDFEIGIHFSWLFSGKRRIEIKSNDNPLTRRVCKMSDVWLKLLLSCWLKRVKKWNSFVLLRMLIDYILYLLFFIHHWFYFISLDICILCVKHDNESIFPVRFKWQTKRKKNLMIQFSIQNNYCMPISIKFVFCICFAFIIISELTRKLNHYVSVRLVVQFRKSIRLTNNKRRMEIIAHPFFYPSKFQYSTTE